MTVPSPERAKFDQVSVTGSAMIWNVAVCAFADRQRHENRQNTPALANHLFICLGPFEYSEYRVAACRHCLLYTFSPTILKHIQEADVHCLPFPWDSRLPDCLMKGAKANGVLYRKLKACRTTNDHRPTTALRFSPRAGVSPPSRM